MKITISIGEQRLTIVAQGDEYEIVLPDRIERSVAAHTSVAARKNDGVSTVAASPLPVENTVEAREILSPAVLRAYGLTLDLLRGVYAYVQEHDLCKFEKVSMAFARRKNSMRIKRALTLLRLVGCVFKDYRERYSTRHVLPSCSDEVLDKVYEIVETMPGIRNREIAELLGHKGPNGGVSDSILYLAGVKRIRAVPEVNRLVVTWRYYPAQ